MKPQCLSLSRSEFLESERFAEMPANRGYFRQSRDRKGALARCVAGKRSRPSGYPGRGSDWGFTFVHFCVARPQAGSLGIR